MAGTVFEWAGWTFEPAEWRLTGAATGQLSLPNRTLDLLALLLERAPSLVTKDEILAAVWPDSVVEEGNIAFHIAMLRKALDAGNNSCFETVRGRGYRFVAPVTRRAPIDTTAPLPDAPSEPAASADATEAETAIAAPVAARKPPSPVVLFVSALTLVGLTAGVGWFWWSSNGRQSRAAQGEARTGRSVNPEAYDLSLQARELWRQRSPHSIQQAIALYERVIAMDPQFARAYAGLADCYNLTMSGLPPEVRYPRALENAEKAVALDPDGPAGHTSLAFLRYKFEWRWKDADAEFSRAVALDPQYALAHHWYGEFLGIMGRYDEGIRHLRRAVELEPQTLAIQSDLVTPLLRAGRVAEARAVVEAAAAINPNWPFIPYRMAEVLRAEGREREAVESHWRWMLLSGASLEAVDRLRAAYDAGGLAGMTRLEIAGYLDVEAATPGAWMNATNLARAYARLGERAAALRWNSIALDRREDAAIGMLTASDYDSLREDPEFTRQLARIGLTPLQRR